MRHRLIDAEKEHNDVSHLARVHGVSRQGYYAWARCSLSCEIRQTLTHSTGHDGNCAIIDSRALAKLDTPSMCPVSRACL